LIILIMLLKPLEEWRIQLKQQDCQYWNQDKPLFLILADLSQNLSRLLTNLPPKKSRQLLKQTVSFSKTRNSPTESVFSNLKQLIRVINFPKKIRKLLKEQDLLTLIPLLVLVVPAQQVS